MSEENIQNENKSVERSHPHGLKSVEDIQEIIKEFDEAIDFHKQRKEIVRKQYELMIAFPKPLEPKFEYETKEEWVELIKQQHSLMLKPKLFEVDQDIKTTEDRKRVYLQMLESGELESEDSKKIEEHFEEVEKKAKEEKGEENG